LAKILERGEDFAGETFAVGVDLPVAGTPAFEEAVEVGPSEGEKSAPFGFDGGGIDGRVLGSEGAAEGGEVVVEKFGLLLLAGGFVETGSDEVGEVFHSAPAAHVLEIDGGDLVAGCGEAEVGELGIAMDEGLVAGFGEELVDGGGGLLEREVVERFEFLTAGGEVPVGAGFPEAGGFGTHESGVEMGEPIEAGQKLRWRNRSEARGVSGGVEVFEDEEDFTVMLIEGKEFWDAAVRSAALAPVAIPGGLDLVGFKFPLVGEV
jgi:hypothetical protein